MFDHHYEDSADIAATDAAVFAFVDDHAQFSSHMSESSWMMGGSQMSTRTDEGKAQAVGSHIVMSGRVLGLHLELDEVVTVHRPPTEKVWETVGKPRLLVIGQYRMRVTVRPTTNGSHLTVAIGYGLPDGALTYWLGRLFGAMYAKWCVKQMLDGVVTHFEQHRQMAA